eukprot:4533938-Prymnesium_polylepis.1
MSSVCTSCSAAGLPDVEQGQPAVREQSGERAEEAEECRPGANVRRQSLGTGSTRARAPRDP